MKVNELIEKLKEFDSELHIAVLYDNWVLDIDNPKLGKSEIRNMVILPLSNKIEELNNLKYDQNVIKIEDWRNKSL